MATSYWKFFRVVSGSPDPVCGERGKFQLHKRCWQGLKTGQGWRGLGTREQTILVFKQESKKYYYNSYVLLSTYFMPGTSHTSVLFITMTLEVGIIFTFTQKKLKLSTVKQLIQGYTDG